ncbi:hypothetical protein SAMD00023353_5800520 [Rosellinia necatrix]|uniref:Zn(2)-C6 fungal-type domain-containing protein n=1 Tax=Rosellinia necatrix TaxID=77044 RepID=A0A1W2TRX4_ROSNE|nr:hypothetical protein SAMD00023353_5800520 [Rosellinia necatrix]
MDSEDPSAAAAAAAKAQSQSQSQSQSLGSRVSVACLPCRNRHVRCDAQQPICIRCSSEGRTCQYVKSRRGGLNRARLAERRRARNSSDGAVTGSPSDDTSAGSKSPGREAGQDYRAPVAEDGSIALPLGYDSGRSPVIGRDTSQQPPQQQQQQQFEGPDGTLQSITDIQFSTVANDFLVKLYYKYFHDCHPCALPQRCLHQHYERSPDQDSLRLLIAVIRFIGSLYACPDLTPQLRAKVVEGFQAAERLAPDLFLAQCHLLYSIALYWAADKGKAREHVDAAIRMALGMGMNRRQCASERGQGDVVLQESIRRTWWQIYCMDAYYAAIKRSPTFPLCEVGTDTDLPCEAEEYESGSIPPPKTLDDFDSREFGPEDQTFSSFAYLIGATRSIALALSAGSPDASNWLSPQTIAEVDAIIDGWFLLLPKSKREVLKEGSVVDELMFQAQMAVHANLIALHRPFSRLPFHPLEGISSCLVSPPTRLPARDAEAQHTQRCLQSMEAQLRLLVLPVKPVHRSPFTVCMTAAGTHAMLAAVRVLFSGRRLAVARHQLRLVVGYIRALARVWPQGARNLEEIQLIAQEVLRARDGPPLPPTTANMTATTMATTTTATTTTTTAAAPQQTATPDDDDDDDDDGGGGGREGAVQRPLENQHSHPPLPLPPSCMDGLEGWGGGGGVGNAALGLEGPDCLSTYWNLNNDFQSDIPIWYSGY